MKEDFFEEERYLNAQKRVKEIKGFYAHLFWYVVVNLFLTISKIYRNINNGETFSEAFFDYSLHSIWFFWGIGIAFHWFGVFGKGFVFSKDWEERKIKEYMDKDKFDY